MKQVKIKTDMDNTKEEIEENKAGAPEKDKNLDSQVINFKDGITIYEGKMTAVIIGAVIYIIGIFILRAPVINQAIALINSRKAKRE